MSEPMIYHIVPEPEFRDRLSSSAYAPESLADIGFVHCALEASVIPVANDYYAQMNGALLLVEIDPAKLAAETRYEAAAPLDGAGLDHLESAPLFPHVYGVIESRAIVRVGVLERDANGFGWPTRFDTCS